MEKSISLLNTIKSECHGNISYYQDNRSICSNYSTKYICGRIDGSIWINELIETYLEYELITLLDFISNINTQKSSLVSVNNDAYNQGLYDQLEEMEIRIYDRIS